jgi:hypothetical protein
MSIARERAVRGLLYVCVVTLAACDEVSLHQIVCGDEICEGSEGCFDCPEDCGVCCGNGRLDPGETCDGDCPAHCDDTNPCTTDTQSGAVETCDIACSHDPVFLCYHGDGCCPGGCDPLNDDDCSCNNCTGDPVAVCSALPDQAVPLQTVWWYGNQSFDRNGRPIVEHRWTVDSFPPGSAASLFGTGADRQTVVDLAGDYRARLVVVNDLDQQSPPCTAAVRVTPDQALWIELYWTHPGDDMDLHLLAPGGSPRDPLLDCYYRNCTEPPYPDWGLPGNPSDDPHLDFDNQEGTGPENINIADPAEGTYTVVVHDYPERVYEDDNPVTVKIYIGGQLAETLSLSVTGEDQDWYICTIDWPSGQISPW